MIHIFNTYIHPNAFEKVKSVLDSTFLSEGKLVKEFEEKLSRELGLINPVAVNSGTSALHLSLLLAGVKEGDEVIVPAQTFVATGLVVLYEKAVPIFADIQYDTGNVDPNSIQTKITEKTKAIIPVHWGGYPCDMDEINDIARRHNLIVIEDAAHALGATYRDNTVGSISRFTCFSFQAIKHLPVGDGGSIACKYREDADKAFNLRWFGIDRTNSSPSILGERMYDIDIPGYKYHLNDYAASLGLANLDGFKQRLERRRHIAIRYKKELSNISGIKFFSESPDRESSYWIFGFHVEKREDFVRALKNRGITASVVHQRIDRNSVFGGIKEDLYNQAKFDETQIHIPVYDALTDEQVEYIIDSIKIGW